MLLPTQIEAMIRLGAPRYAIFMLIETKSGPLRMWTGVGNMELEPDLVDEDGGEYLGIALVGEIPAIRQLAAGTAERVEFALSMLDEETFRLCDDDADDVIDAPVHLGVIFFDEDWSQSPPLWIWEGRSDVVSPERDATGAQVVRQIKLSVGTTFTERTRALMEYWTDAEQRRRSPTDDFFIRVAGYSLESTIKWPA